MSFKKSYLKTKPICKVTFKITSEEAKKAREVKLVGDFNTWDEAAKPMKRLKNGGFTQTVDLPVEQSYQFRYLIDDEAWENDWNADAYVPNGMSGDDNSVVQV
ncbi:isoamylase early set domain-containing protein [Agaribacter marinus]|uniref:1,4-alpha-glucan-branching protein n=1 Tax=Agaribacter marinus TaxID=1431249 RepID=A0AA37SZT0_9ALTE|nr:isoamylase early set domain-containing protein [Agaribacter marinus]GLR69623.1 1,4-alpha-glucan-branching protein [Agaribacter marinus]